MYLGRAGALNCVLHAIFNDGCERIVPAPYFAEYVHYCANHGGTLRPVPTKNDFSLDIDAIKAALTEKTAAVIINSPNNPTGRIYSREQIQALSAVRTAHGEKTGR